ncbi:hypothetical protein [Mesoplasma photuris]|uniref:hypothetical protein n=1 Tax=Mesoplasma photuris TaxID=217731 RepID=UPI0004E0F838|nr:hypothetical protein [Mesoplasma photuris]
MLFTKLNDIIVENKVSLDKISNKEACGYLLDTERGVKFDVVYFKNKNLSKEMLRLIENKIFINQSKAEIIDLWMKNETEVSVFNSKNWKFKANAPATWYEWIVFIWRLDANNEFCVDFVEGGANISDIIDVLNDALGGIPGMGLLIPLIGAIAQLIIWASTTDISNNNKGNGVRFRFLMGVAITGVSPSPYNWN